MKNRYIASIILISLAVPAFAGASFYGNYGDNTSSSCISENGTGSWSATSNINNCCLGLKAQDYAMTQSIPGSVLYKCVKPNITKPAPVNLKPAANYTYSAPSYYYLSLNNNLKYLGQYPKLLTK